MFQITYLSTEARRQIDRMKQQPLFDPKQIELRNGKIRAIEAQSKPYTECTADELQDLQGQLVERANKLMGIGKAELAQQFIVMNQMVEQQYQYKLLDRQVRDKEAKDRTDAQQAARENRPPPTQTKQGRDRWTTRISPRGPSDSDSEDF